MKPFILTLMMIETLAGASLLTSCRMVSRIAEDPSNSPGVVMVEADEWDEVIYTIKGSEITLQSTGHFYAEPNACFRKESGVFELSLWNRMAEISNSVWRAWQSPEAPPLLEQAQCITAPAGAPSIPSGVEMKIWKGSPQKIIDSINSTQICSRISNLELLRNFVLILGEASTIARQEGC